MTIWLLVIFLGASGDNGIGVGEHKSLSLCEKARRQWEVEPPAYSECVLKDRTIEVKPIETKPKRK